MARSRLQALQWLESNRAVMDDAHIKAGWFLAHPNGTVLNTPRTYAHNTTSPLLGQYYIDWRNADAAAYFAGVRQLRHHFGPALRDIWALYHPTHAVYCALLGYHAYRMLIGACDPMV